MPYIEDDEYMRHLKEIAMNAPYHITNPKKVDLKEQYDKLVAQQEEKRAAEEQEERAREES